MNRRITSSCCLCCMVALCLLLLRSDRNLISDQPMGTHRKAEVAVAAASVVSPNTTRSIPSRMRFSPRRLPCQAPNASVAQGVHFVNIPKTDSRYWHTIMNRAMHSLQEAQESHQDDDSVPTKCHYDYTHTRARDRLKKRNRKDVRQLPSERERLFMFSFVREPLDLMLRNYYFFEISKKPHKKPHQPLSRYMGRHGNLQANYLSLHNLDFNILQQSFYWTNQSSYSQEIEAFRLANHIVQSYDFVGVVERPAESLVALQFILGWKSTDILYNPSGNAGTKSFFVDSKSGLCKAVHPIPESLPRETQDYIDQEWSVQNQVELQLYRVANQKLDQWIADIGEARFKKALKDHERWMKKVRDHCLPLVEYRCQSVGSRPSGGADQSAPCIESVISR